MFCGNILHVIYILDESRCIKCHIFGSEKIYVICNIIYGAIGYSMKVNVAYKIISGAIGHCQNICYTRYYGVIGLSVKIEEKCIV